MSLPKETEEPFYLFIIIHLSFFPPNKTTTCLKETVFQCKFLLKHFHYQLVAYSKTSRTYSSRDVSEKRFHYLPTDGWTCQSVRVMSRTLLLCLRSVGRFSVIGLLERSGTYSFWKWSAMFHYDLRYKWHVTLKLSATLIWWCVKNVYMTCI